MLVIKNSFIDLIFNREVDFSIGPYTVTAERAEVIDFTYPITMDHWTIMLPLGNEAADPWLVAKPLGLNVWAVLVMAVPTIIMVLLLRHVSMNGRINVEKYFATVCGFVFRSIVVQPPVWFPNQFAVEKMLGVFWSFMMFVLCCSYAGVLTSLLTVPSFSIPIDRYSAGAPLFQF